MVCASGPLPPFCAEGWNTGLTARAPAAVLDHDIILRLAIVHGGVQGIGYLESDVLALMSTLGFLELKELNP